MFGKTKSAEPVAVANHYGWTDDRLAFLKQMLSHKYPQFEIPLSGFRQSFGRSVNRPDEPITENEITGLMPVFKARVDGRFNVAPNGTVGGIAMQGRGSDEEGYKPSIYLHLDLLDDQQEAKLQHQLTAAFAAKLTPTLLVYLEPVIDLDDRLSELREDGGFDALPLASFCLITEYGQLDI